MAVLLGSVKSQDKIKELRRLLTSFLNAEDKIEYNYDGTKVAWHSRRQAGAAQRLSTKAYKYARENGISDLEVIQIHSELLKQRS